MGQQLRSGACLLHHLRCNGKYEYKAGELKVKFSLVVNVALVLPAEAVIIGQTERAVLLLFCCCEENCEFA